MTMTARVESLRNALLERSSLLAQAPARLLHAHAQSHPDAERGAVFAANRLRYMLRALPVEIGADELIAGHAEGNRRSRGRPLPLAWIIHALGSENA